MIVPLYSLYRTESKKSNIRPPLWSFQLVQIPLFSFSYMNNVNNCEIIRNLNFCANMLAYLYNTVFWSWPRACHARRAEYLHSSRKHKIFWDKRGNWPRKREAAEGRGQKGEMIKYSSGRFFSKKNLWLPLKISPLSPLFNSIDRTKYDQVLNLNFLNVRKCQ